MTYPRKAVTRVQHTVLLTIALSETRTVSHSSVDAISTQIEHARALDALSVQQALDYIASECEHVADMTTDAIGPQHEMKYDCVWQARGMKLPPSMTQTEIEVYCTRADDNLTVDAMTDQIDVYRGKRKVATFMAGE